MKSFLNSEEFMQPKVCEFTKDGLTITGEKQPIEPPIDTVSITKYSGYSSLHKLSIFCVCENKTYWHLNKIIWILFCFLKTISYTSE